MAMGDAARSPVRANLVLATLFLGMFVIGSTELLVVGVLDLIATDLRVSVSTAGTLVTVYALGLAIGGPILTALTIKLDKRTVLIGALALFTLGNVIVVMTTSFGVLLAARTVTGAVQGLFIAAAFVTGASAVSPARAGRAISVVISGVAVSGAVGVPVGTLAGQALGWRGSFAAAAVLAVIALMATSATVPSVSGSAAGAVTQVKHALAPRVLCVVALIVLIFASVYAALTYIVPFLQTVTGISGGVVSVFLLAYGGAAAVGSFGGGRFADNNAPRTLIVGSVGVGVCLLVLFAAGTVAVLVAAALVASGIFAMGMAPSMQYRVVSLAGPGGAFAQSLPASAANVGIAFGSLVGGIAVARFTVSAAVIAGLAIAVVTVPIAWATSRLTPPAEGLPTRGASTVHTAEEHVAADIG
jgi:MFS transporter, DHA1 family, inner membrane transport protein